MAITLNGTTGVTTTGLTSNGIDDNATSTAMTLDSSGNVLVGKASNAFGTTGVALNPDGSNNMTRASDPPLALNRLTSDGSILGFYKDGTTVGSIGVYNDGASSPYFADQGNVGIRLSQASTDDIVPCSTTGSDRDAAINLGASSSRFKDLYLSGGVYLGGTGAANKLDDYEEGSWTPSFGADGSNPTMTYITQVGRYTKIGNLVTAYCQMITASRSGGSGTLTVDGLPFTVAPAVSYASATIGFNYNWNTPPLSAGAQGSQTHVILYQDATINAVATPVDIVASGNSYFYFIVSYETTS